VGAAELPGAAEQAGAPDRPGAAEREGLADRPEVAERAESGERLEVASSSLLPDPAIVSIRETFAIVAQAGDKAAGFFYGRLFARYPQLRAMFPPAMDHQRDRLLAALVRIVESLSTPEELAEYLGQLGRDHRKFGVEPVMYNAVGEALIVTLRSFAGPAFTPAAQDAWTQAYAAASSIMIGAAEEAGVYAPAYYTAEVIGNERRHHGIAVLTVAPDQLLDYEAGQHVTVQSLRWPRVWRSYSIACRPREDGLMIFHVRAVSGGWVSNALVQHSPPGTDLILGPALGTMVLRHAGRRDLLCVAGGTGLSPLKAIIEQAVKESSTCPRKIYLFYGARRREELYDLPDLWRLADAYPGLQIIPVTSEDPAFAGMQGNVGRVAARYLPHRDCEAYVSGPPVMVAETIRVLKRAGIPPERIHYDDALLTGHDRPADPGGSGSPGTPGGSGGSGRGADPRAELERGAEPGPDARPQPQPEPGQGSGSGPEAGAGPEPAALRDADTVPESSRVNSVVLPPESLRGPGDQLKLAALVVDRQQVPLLGGREAALRADRQVLARHVLGRFVDPP
jgi:NAD(P)H-flavin reductase/hemoglobin-like flavoprotein